MLATNETMEQAPSHVGVGDHLTGTYLTFDLAGQVLGVDVRNVREILDQATVRLLPNAPHDIEGIVDIRGASIPVVDMGARLALPRSADGEDTRIIVFEIEDGEAVRPLGVLADRVRNVTQITSDQIESPPSIAGSNWDADVLRGLARQGSSLILLLDICKVFGAGDLEFGRQFC